MFWELQFFISHSLLSSSSHTHVYIHIRVHALHNQSAAPGFSPLWCCCCFFTLHCYKKSIFLRLLVRVSVIHLNEQIIMINYIWWMESRVSEREKGASEQGWNLNNKNTYTKFFYHLTHSSAQLVYSIQCSSFRIGNYLSLSLARLPAFNL